MALPVCFFLGPEEAASRMHTHWQTWFTEKDFEEMATTHGVNQIRIPMGRWDVYDEHRLDPCMHGEVVVCNM